MAKNPAKAAIRRGRNEIGSYFHPECRTRTEVSDDLIEAMVLDPWAFPLDETVCVGCGSARMDEAFVTKRRTLYEACSDLRDEVPAIGKAFRFAIVPLLFGLVGAAISPMLPMKGGTSLATALGVGIFACIPGYGVSPIIFRTLRRSGFFW